MKTTVMVIQFTIGAEARAALTPPASRIGFVRVDDTGASGAEGKQGEARTATVVKLSRQSFFDASRVNSVFGQIADPSKMILPVDSPAFATVDLLTPELPGAVATETQTTDTSLGKASVVASTAPTVAKESLEALQAGVAVGLPPSLVSQQVTAIEQEPLPETPPVAQSFVDNAVQAVGSDRNDFSVGLGFAFDEPRLEPAAGTGLGPASVAPEQENSTPAPPAISRQDLASQQIVSADAFGSASIVGITPADEFLDNAGVGQTLGDDPVTREFQPSLDALDVQPSFETFFRPPQIPPSSAERIAEDERKPVKGPEVELVNKFGTAGQTAIDEEGLTRDQLREVLRLQTRDQEVRAHEQAHRSAAGGLASAPTFTLQSGPDGRQYAIGGEVQIDTSSTGTPQEKIAKAQIIRRAAMAPANPSAQDHSVSASASQTEIQARAEMAREQREEVVEAANDSSAIATDSGGVPSGIGNMDGAEVAGISARDQAPGRVDDGLAAETVQGTQRIASMEGPTRESVSRLAGMQGKAHAAYTLAENAYQDRGDYIALA